MTNTKWDDPPSRPWMVESSAMLMNTPEHRKTDETQVREKESCWFPHEIPMNPLDKYLHLQSTNVDGATNYIYTYGWVNTYYYPYVGESTFVNHINVSNIETWYPLVI